MRRLPLPQLSASEGVMRVSAERTGLAAGGDPSLGCLPQAATQPEQGMASGGAARDWNLE